METRTNNDSNLQRFLCYYATVARQPIELPREQSRVLSMIFTDEKEAKVACREKIAESIQYLEERIDCFKNYEV